MTIDYATWPFKPFSGIPVPPTCNTWRHFNSSRSINSPWINPESINTNRNSPSIVRQRSFPRSSCGSEISSNATSFRSASTPFFSCSVIFSARSGLKCWSSWSPSRNRTRQFIISFIRSMIIRRSNLYSSNCSTSWRNSLRTCVAHGRIKTICRNTTNNWRRESMRNRIHPPNNSSNLLRTRRVVIRICDRRWLADSTKQLTNNSHSQPRFITRIATRTFPLTLNHLSVRRRSMASLDVCQSIF